MVACQRTPIHYKCCCDYDKAINTSVSSHSSKLHLIFDACGNLVHVELTGGKVHDSTMVNTLIKSNRKKDTKAVVIEAMTVVTSETVSLSTVLNPSYPLSQI